MVWRSGSLGKSKKLSNGRDSGQTVEIASAHFPDGQSGGVAGHRTRRASHRFKLREFLASGTLGFGFFRKSGRYTVPMLPAPVRPQIVFRFFVDLLFRQP